MTTIQAIRFENVSFEAHHTSILKNITGIIELILSLPVPCLFFQWQS